MGGSLGAPFWGAKDLAAGILAWGFLVGFCEEDLRISTVGGS